VALLGSGCSSKPFFSSFVVRRDQMPSSCTTLIWRASEQSE
jgi:hypothetical protein